MRCWAEFSTSGPWRFDAYGATVHARQYLGHAPDDLLLEAVDVDLHDRRSAHAARQHVVAAAHRDLRRRARRAVGLDQRGRAQRVVGAAVGIEPGDEPSASCRSATLA